MGFIKNLIDKFKKKQTIKKVSKKTDYSKENLGSSINSNQISENKLRGQERSEYVRDTVEEFWNNNEEADKSFFKTQFVNKTNSANGGFSKVNSEALDNELGSGLRKRRPSN